jgi:hypothetical protein
MMHCQHCEKGDGSMIQQIGILGRDELLGDSGIASLFSPVVTRGTPGLRRRSEL